MLEGRTWSITLIIFENLHKLTNRKNTFELTVVKANVAFCSMTLDSATDSDTEGYILIWTSTYQHQGLSTWRNRITRPLELRSTG
jgi:hypothetical protein